MKCNALTDIDISVQSPTDQGVEGDRVLSCPLFMGLEVKVRVVLGSSQAALENLLQACGAIVATAVGIVWLYFSPPSTHELLPVALFPFC